MTNPRVADGGDGLKIWRTGVKILNNKSLAGEKGWSSTLRVGQGDKSLS